MLNLQTHIFYLKHKIMNIYQLNKYVSCVLMYKHNSGMLPNTFNDMLTKHIISHNHNMRQETVYTITYCKTNTRQNTLPYISPKLWNAIVIKKKTLMIVRLFIYLKRQ